MFSLITSRGQQTFRRSFHSLEHETKSPIEPGIAQNCDVNTLDTHRVPGAPSYREGVGMKYLVSTEELPSFNVGRPGILAAIFNGGDHRLPGISIILNETLPGDGAPLHRHTYDELFLVQDGQCCFTVADQTVEAGPGQLVLIPAGAPHGFTNIGDANMRLVAIHAAPRVEIEWLDAGVPI